MKTKLSRSRSLTARRWRIKARYGAKTMRATFADQAHFVGALVQSPRNTGALAPTSRELADMMAAETDLSSGLPVLELGPGTGAISRSILKGGLKPEALVAVEYEQRFCRKLALQFPAISVVQGDAFDLDTTLQGHRHQHFDCVISGLPLLNFPEDKRVKLLRDVLARIPKGRPFVQFSYGVTAPIPVRDPAIRVERSAWIWRNLPPARVWTYRLDPARPSDNG